jgi:hypothetical protein
MLAFSIKPSRYEKGFKGPRDQGPQGGVNGVKVKPAVPRRGTFSIARRSRAAEPWNP